MCLSCTFQSSYSLVQGTPSRQEFSSISDTSYLFFCLFFSPTATVAKVIDRFEDETTDEVLPVGNIRKRASASLLEADKRYSGKATSRKALQEELWGDVLSEEGSGKRNLIFSPLFAGKPCCHHVAEHGKPQGPVTKSSSN